MADPGGKRRTRPYFKKKNKGGREFLMQNAEQKSLEIQYPNILFLSKNCRYIRISEIKVRLM